MKVRIGIGFDIHRLETGRGLTLGGVEIPHEKGLAGHSDGDVLYHAIIDALLGACGLGNIGEKFPDTDPRFRNIDSGVLLRGAAQMMRNAGYNIGNIDSNILAERPKLLSYFGQMRQNIASVLEIPVADIHVKAKTMERLGPVGAEEAIAAEAVVLVYADTNVDDR